MDVLTPRRGRGFLLTLCLLLGALAGCQSADEASDTTELAPTTTASSPTSTTPAPTTTATDAPPAELREATLVVPGTGFYQAPILLAIERGFMEEQGVDLTVLHAESGGDVLAGVIGRSADMAVLAYEHVLRAASEGQILIAEANLLQNHIVNISVAADFGVDPEAPLEERLESLRGKNVALPGAGGAAEVLLLTLLEEVGISEDEINRHYLGGDPFAYISAIEADQIDAGAFVEPSGLLLEARDIGYTLIDVMGGDVPELSGFMMQPIVARPDADLELVQAVIEGTRQGLDFIYDAPRAEVVQAISALYPQTDAEMVEPLLEAHLTVWDRSMAVSLEGAQALKDWVVRTGTIQEDDVDVSDTLRNP